MKLSEGEYNLLNKGLTFIPTPKTLPISTILENKSRLIRSIKLKCAFNDTNNNYNPKIKTFTGKSTWYPGNALLYKNNTLDVALNVIDKINNLTNEAIDKAKKCYAQPNEHIILNNKFNLNNDELSAINKIKITRI